MAESLKGKVAVITGVGSGFAKATAELFATADQVGLVLIDINEKALEATRSKRPDLVTTVPRTKAPRRRQRG